MTDGQQGRNPIKEKLDELFKELKVYSTQKKEINAKIEGINRQIGDQERARTAEQKNIHPVYNDQDKLDRGIKELEKRLTIMSISRQDENAIIKEIKQVKESGVYFKKIEQINDRIKGLKKQRDEVRADLTPIIKISNQIKDKIDKVKQEDSVFGNEKKLFQMDLVNLNSQMDSIQEKISDLRQQRYDLREDFYGKKCDYEIQLAFIKDIEWIKKIKEGVMEREERREI